MNAEGVAVIITPEWLQTVVTAGPLFVLAVWCAWWPLVAWRAAIWREAGAEMQAASSELRGQLEPSWAGWRVVTEAHSIHWVGGVFGAVTIVVLDGQRTRLPGLRPAAEVVSLLSR
ncbi:MAG: hypothetical protein ACI9K2_001519 [Myxococcota bacterium]